MNKALNALNHNPAAKAPKTLGARDLSSPPEKEPLEAAFDADELRHIKKALMQCCCMSDELELHENLLRKVFYLEDQLQNQPSEQD